MSHINTRRAVKFGLTAAVAVAAYGLDIKIDPKQGFDVATITSGANVGVSEANAACGVGMGCSGGGGQCGVGMGCSGGGGQCGVGMGCAGS